MLRKRRNVHLLHIGKTGGTAIKSAVRRSDAAHSLIVHPHQVTIRDIPSGDGVVFFIRDPLERFVSGFFSRKRQGWPGHSVPWNSAEREAFGRFETPDALAIALDDSAEERQAAASAAMTSIEHVRSSYWDWFIDEQYMEARWQDVLFIGQQESLESDFEALKVLMDWPGDLALPTDPQMAHQSPSGEERGLSDRAVRNLARWYAADYKFLELCARRRFVLGHRPFAIDYAMPSAAPGSE